MSKDPRFKPLAIRSPRGGRSTEVDWADGHKSVYPHAILRGYCPCASCQGHSGDIHFVQPTDEQQELDEIAVVGNYALSLTWFDRHAGGIYSFNYLRGLCQCDKCRRIDEGPAARR